MGELMEAGKLALFKFSTLRVSLSANERKAINRSQVIRVPKHTFRRTFGLDYLVLPALSTLVFSLLCPTTNHQPPSCYPEDHTPLFARLAYSLRMSKL